MSLTIPNKTQEQAIGAGLFVPVTPEMLYEVARDVRGFPLWAPGVRRVEVVGGPDNGPGMASEWEVSFLGVRKKVGSVLEDAEPPRYLRWSYDGPVRGWGECEISALGDGALAGFRTSLRPEDPTLSRLMQTPAARSAATAHLKRCLACLGRTVSGGSGGVRVGPLEISH